MMKFLQGNLLDAPTEALVNTVNTVGVMGKGIAHRKSRLRRTSLDYQLSNEEALASAV
jgi:hypothetical protein